MSTHAFVPFDPFARGRPGMAAASGPSIPLSHGPRGLELRGNGVPSLPRAQAIAEAHLGFKALSRKLAKKGASDPDALAAYIGRQKYGAAAMAKKSAAGRKGK